MTQTHPRSLAMMKRIAMTVALVVVALGINAQNSNTYEFLNIPVSARAAALGGQNITVIENDYTMASQNPALLPCLSQRNVSLSYMHYIKGVNIASASFSSFVNDRLGWAVGAQYMGYGKMTRADVYGNKQGEFGAKDMALTASFSYEFNDYWSGGVTGKFLYSGYDHYSSLGLGFDFGLNYYKQRTDFSFSIVARNLGAQLKHYTGGEREHLPANLLVGISKRLAHAPLRLSITMQDLQYWGNSAASEAAGEEQKFFNKLLDKFVIGLDFIPTKNIYVALGYNCKTASAMKVNGASHWAGFTFGAGLKIKQFRLGASYARYHVAASSFMVNLSLGL